MKSKLTINFALSTALSVGALSLGCMGHAAQMKTTQGEVAMEKQGAYGTAYKYKEKVPVKFQTFSVGFSREETIETPASLTLVKLFFSITDQQGNAQEIKVTYSQTPPSPVEFSVNNEKFLLVTHAMPDGRRLEAETFAIIRK